MRRLFPLLLLCAVGLASPRDELWCRFRGPAHGRAQVASAPAPPLKRAWVIDLWDPDGNQRFDDAVLFEPKMATAEGWPLGLGIAWRVDSEFVYAFEVGYYSAGRKVALFDRRTGRYLWRVESERAQPIANKRAFSVHDDFGFGHPQLFFGSFYGGQRLMTVRDRRIEPLDFRALGVRLGGHSCEGQRWLKGRLFLDGAGARISEGRSFSWGSNLCSLDLDGKTRVHLRDVSVPCAAWDEEAVVLYTRGDLTGGDARATFARQEYLRVQLSGRTLKVMARRSVTGELYEDAPVKGGRMLNRARNAVHAMAIGVDGRHVYCQERTGAQAQRIVRRRLNDFAVDAAIPERYLPPVSEVAFLGHANPELAVGFAVDAQRFYLHLHDRLEAYSLDFREQNYRVPLPTRTLNAHTPFAMNRYFGGSQMVYANRGTENTIATDGRHLYLTTDKTLQVHSCRTGKLLWTHTFEKLPFCERNLTRGPIRGWVSREGLPGDVLLAEDAVYVATHTVQTRLYCFQRATQR